MISVRESLDEFDFFNSKGLRNADNTDCWDFNCAGLALDTFSWYSVYKNGNDCDDEAYEIGELLDSYSLKEIYRIKLEEYVTKMLNDFSNLRVIEDEDELEDDERLIIFRIGIGVDYGYEEKYVSTDFHFRWYNKKEGHWYEKCGSSDIRICDEEMEFDYWPCHGEEFSYDSEPVYLALKERRN